MEANKEKHSVSERFNKIHWHDCKLIEVHIAYIADSHHNDIYLKIRLLTNPEPGNYVWANASLIIKDCTIIRMNLDLTAKLTCSDDISAAFCERETVLKKQIERDALKYEDNPFTNYLHFHIGLIPPAGEIDMFARDFDLIIESN